MTEAESINRLNKAVAALKGNPAGSSVLPTTETAGPVSALAVTNCSLPVSSADFLQLAARWEYAAAMCKRGDYLSCEQTGARMLLACAKDLRRQVEISTERQPEENVADEGRASAPSASLSK